MFMEPDLFSFGNKIACTGVSVWAIPAMISATFLLRVLGLGGTYLDLSIRNEYSISYI